MNPTIHVINLDRDNEIDPYANPQLKEEIKRFREERALSIVKQSKQFCFQVRFWEGITDNKTFPCVNIMKAFKKIVMYAKEENLPFVVIGEDDLFFTGRGAWQYYLDNFPKDFDLYSAGIYSGQIQEGRIINGFSGNTLISVKESFYDFLLSANEDPLGLGQGHLDRWLGNFCFEKKYMIVQPFCVKQIWGYSDNHRKKMTYEQYENWDYFK